MAARKRTNRTRNNPSGEDWAPRFLRELEACGVIGAAAKRARVSKSNVYDRMKSDPEFAAAVPAALEGHDDDLEATARRRAKAKSDKLLLYFVKRRHDREEGKVGGGRTRRGKLHLHLHLRPEQLEQKYEAMPDDEFEREYQDQIGSRLLDGGPPGPPADGAA